MGLRETAVCYGKIIRLVTLLRCLFCRSVRNRPRSAGGFDVVSWISFAILFAFAFGIIKLIERQNRVISELGSEPLTRIAFRGMSIVLEPVRPEHRNADILRRIATYSAYGLRVEKRSFGWFANSVQLSADHVDPDIWRHVRTTFADGDMIALSQFSWTLTEGYAQTLSPGDRNKFMSSWR